jgi:hypothetical protein
MIEKCVPVIHGLIKKGKPRPSDYEVIGKAGFMVLSRLTTIRSRVQQALTKCLRKFKIHGP